MRRAAGSVLVALVVALILPTSVLAAKAERQSDTSLQLWCGELQSEAGSAYVNAWIGEGETFADLGFWATPAEQGEDSVTWAGWSNEALMSVGDSALEITFGVYVPAEDEEHEPVFVGDAIFSATLTPAGDVETFRSNDQYGNAHSRSSGSLQQYDVAGSLVLPDDISFDLSSCDIFRISEDWFSNAPTHSVSHSGQLDLSCGWETEDGYAALFAVNYDVATGANVWISSGGSFLIGAGDATLSSSAFEASFDLYPGWDAEEPVGTASASATLSRLDRVSDTQVFGDSRYTFKGARLGVSGNLTIESPAGTTSFPMDDASCQASDIRISELPARHERVQPVENDTPDAALPLKVGDKLLVSTSGTEAAPEAPCFLDDGEGGTFEVPVSNSVWWRIEGTGGSLTIDTAGSSFDTVVAVYLVDGTSVGEQVGCVDDVDEGAQARITFDAAAGTLYFVQTGGFDGETGDLALLISEP
jgi:hypothetical protein